MMDDTRGYRSGIVLFGLAAILSAAAALYSSQCCAAFPPDVQAGRAGFVAPQPQGMQWLGAALVDRPEGYRLTLMSFTASVIGLATASAGRVFASASKGPYARLWAAYSTVTASFLVGVLYILVFYIAGYAGYRGPLVLVAWLSISAAVALMYLPNRAALILAVPLAPAGFIAAGITSMVTGIPLD